MVTAEGGRGIAVRTDHTAESEVERLFERVRAEEGRLDVLVNDIWGGDALTEWGSPFWSLSTAQGQALLERAVHSHIITSRHGAPLMIERNGGLIVEVTDGDTFGYRGNLFYDLAKNAVIRLAYAMAGDLHAHRVTALAVTPGFLRSEHVLDHFGVTEANWRDAIEKDPYFAESETPCYVGRAVAALAADPDVGRRRAGCSRAGHWRRSTASRTSTDAGRTGAASSCARCGKSSTRRRRRTTWTDSWSAPGSTRPSSTRREPRKPSACAPGWPGMSSPRVRGETPRRTESGGCRLYCGMPVMQPPDDRGVDWTGVRPDDSPIAPLDSRSFVVRLRRLSERARDLTLLRRARTEQHTHEKRLSRDPERTS